jgi:hypothetical protein
MHWTRRATTALAGVAALAATAGACAPDPGPPPTTTDPDFAPGCYVDAPEAPNYSDVVYSGPINTRGNARNDEGCDGNPTFWTTLVRADDAAAADALCQALTGEGAGEQPYQVFFPTMPADIWKCVENYLE